MTTFLKTLLKDKHHSYSLRELAIAICMLLLISSWVAELCFGVHTPEHMIYALVSLIAAGCFGYSIEKQSINQIDKDVEDECNKK